MRAITLGSVVFVAAVIALTALGWPARPYVDVDFVQFWLAGRALLEGLDPYDAPTWIALHDRVGSAGLEIVPPGSPFAYPLYVAVLATPFALFPIAVAAPLWLVTQVTAACVALVALARRLFATTARRDTLLLLALAASSWPAAILANGGNLGGFLLAITAGAVTLLLGGHALAAGALLGFLAIKPHPFLVFVPALLIFVPDARERRSLIAGGVSVVLALFALALAVSPGWPGEWLASTARLVSLATPRANVWGLFGGDARWASWLLAAASLLALFAWWRRRRPSLALLAGGALALSLFLAPYGWSYDQLVLLVTVAAAMSTIAAAPDRVRYLGLALLAALLVAGTWSLQVLAVNRGNESLSGVTPLALFGALVLLDNVTARDSGTER